MISWTNSSTAPRDGFRVSLCYPAVVNVVFALLVILGIVVDPTKAGAGNSERTTEYEEPWNDRGKTN